MVFFFLRFHQISLIFTKHFISQINESTSNGHAKSVAKMPMSNGAPLLSHICSSWEHFECKAKLSLPHKHIQFYQHIIRVLTYLYHLCIATHSARLVPTENLDFEQFHHSNWICMANGDLPHEKHAKNTSRSMSWILFVRLQLCMSWSFSLIAFSISFSPPSKIVWSLLLLVQFAHFYCV